MNKRSLKITVNGESRALEAEPHRSLLDVLREELAMTGTKKGCDAGDCGACTVLLDGMPVNACLVLAVQADGRAVDTVEGLASGEELHPLQEAFVEHGAAQCGFCTPGILMNSVALLREGGSLSRGDIQEALSGNLCRCTGYVQIVDAIESVAESR